jgi:hypothetical protein
MPTAQPLSLAQIGPQSGAMTVANKIRIAIPVVSSSLFLRITSFHPDSSTLRFANPGVNGALAGSTSGS